MQVTKRGLTFSRLTLGTVQLGLPYGIANKSGKPDEAAAASILDAALAGGISCFDTANAYGNSEEVLHGYFDRHPDVNSLIVTKMTIRAEAESAPAEVERLIYDAVASSQSNLGLAKLPVLMLHNPEIMEAHAATVTRVAKQLVKEGLVERMGVSLRVVAKREFDALWETLQDDVYEALQVPINLLDSRPLTFGGLQKMEQTGKLVFARSIFLQGLLFMEEADLPAHLREAAGPLSMLRTIAAREGMTMAQLAFSFVRDLPAVHSIVFGAETAKQVQDNLDWFHGPAIGESARADIIRLLDHLPEHIVNPAYWTAAAK